MSSSSLIYCTLAPGLKYTKVEIKKIQELKMYLLFKGGNRRRILSVEGDQLVRSTDKVKVKYIGASNVCMKRFRIIYGIKTKNILLIREKFFPQKMMHKLDMLLSLIEVTLVKLKTNHILYQFVHRLGI